MKNNNTYKDVLNKLDMLDSEGIVLYVKTPVGNIPVDNFEFMKILSIYSPDDESDVSIKELDDVYYVVWD